MHIPLQLYQIKEDEGGDRPDGLIMIKAQAWIFLTVGLGLSLLAGVIVTVCVLCILARRNQRRERR